ncbi:MAG: hypothetical protein COV59_00335 [Candidatus Magasanikbacteria bacterium CG11_big_fil_rev_8_21_14_0_20_39_34]|uniref:UPF0235 protein COV59_00335 n=1 Tax=Candidatus Magasanikbacteria bacterium CG11_big_fil_rev_8_21_14_0_20_39_34 TaxID=1974653 RepID=A0A2H0N6M8_9BACT|nr:MAG: hypothetical protein COV59_00335 [Candidatus Magasanikbacteria bacterium CG11_big_fil_rev_8_21_14_0_20_39_34]
MKISVKVIPKSSQNKIIGNIKDGSIKVKLTAPPVDGAANKALIVFLSKELKIPKSKIQILKGEGSKNKILSLDIEKP